MEEICRNVVDALVRRGYDAVYCATAEEAASAVLAEVDAAQRVGMGGSVTMKELGVTAKLEESGKLQTRGADCDLFLLSANAITSDGRIVNIDGNGNRVAASVSGPKKVIYAIGRNIGSDAKPLAGIKSTVGGDNEVAALLYKRAVKLTGSDYVTLTHRLRKGRASRR